MPLQQNGNRIPEQSIEEKAPNITSSEPFYYSPFSIYNSPFTIRYFSAMLPHSHEFFMQYALREAQNAYDADEVPVGAVIIIHNKIIARGYNQVELLKDPTAHAEILAITAACNAVGAKYLPEASLYVTVEPCLMCCGAIYWSKIGHIVYGAQDDKNGYRHITQEQWPFHPKAILNTGVLAQECAQLMKDFFKARRR